jgi:hypothetical protein
MGRCFALIELTILVFLLREFNVSMDQRHSPTFNHMDVFHSIQLSLTLHVSQSVDTDDNDEMAYIPNKKIAASIVKLRKISPFSGSLSVVEVRDDKSTKESQTIYP